MAARMKRLAAITLGTSLAVTLLAGPASAFDASNSLTSGGVTYSAKATSCNLYLTACSWNTSASISQSKSFTHRSDVKANGINVSLSISADPSASISGNSTSLATATETGYGRSNTMSGTASPSIFSRQHDVPAPRSRLLA